MQIWKAGGKPMKTEKEKMLAGELYDALDPELVQARERARDLCHDLNATREREQGTRRRILSELFGSGGDSVWMQPPFYCDYGNNKWEAYTIKPSESGDIASAERWLEKRKWRAWT